MCVPACVCMSGGLCMCAWCMDVRMDGWMDITCIHCVFRHTHSYINISRYIMYNYTLHDILIHCICVGLHTSIVNGHVIKHIVSLLITAVYSYKLFC